MIVLKEEIAKSEESVGGELIGGPRAFAFEIEESGAKVGTAGDGCGFGEVEMSVVGGLKVGAAKVGDVAGGGKIGVARVPFE